MIPVVSIVGKSDSGKTTLLEKLIAELVSRGVKVAAIKHDAHSFDIDHEGKDSWRLAQAGAHAVLISSPSKFAVVRNVEAEWPIETLIDQLGSGFDLVVTEGYKGAAKPKIEVLRGERSRELMCSEDELIAVATDLDIEVGVPVFNIDDACGIAGFIEERFLPSRLFDPQLAVSEVE